MKYIETCCSWWKTHQLGQGCGMVPAAPRHPGRQTVSDTKASRHSWACSVRGGAASNLYLYSPFGIRNGPPYNLAYFYGSSKGDTGWFSSLLKPPFMPNTRPVFTANSSLKKGRFDKLQSSNKVLSFSDRRGTFNLIEGRGHSGGQGL